MTVGAARITLLTDFGSADGYVAAMKGVIASRAPRAILDDVGHDVPQGDVRRAAWSLSRYWNRFPPGTIHLVVVDPGVGTGRRALAVAADRRFVVAPDNGVVGRVLAEAERWRAVEIGAGPEKGDRSATFHGRDVFAPAAARLALGVELAEMGADVADPVRLGEPAPTTEADGRVRGEVVAVDRFGNLITNVPAGALPDGGRVEIRGRTVPLRVTYGSVAGGELLALVNSAERLEVAVRDGSAVQVLGASTGTPIEVVPDELRQGR